MRLLHTGDWHLGRTLHGAGLTEDQAHVLDQLVGLARQERPHAVLVAGDVYDRGVPPAEAIELLDEVVCRLVLDVGAPVVMIAGNHDSPERLAFGCRLLGERGLHILGQPEREPTAVVLHDEHGPVHLYPVPYADPAQVRRRQGRQDLQGHQEALQYLLDGIRQRHPAGRRCTAVAHCFVAGLAECESERPLCVGGVGTVGAETFRGFDYVALGHLHRPQRCAGGRIRYSGSLMRYSFMEADHEKGVLLVEMDAAGRCQVRSVPLVPRRQVRCLQGTLAGVLEGAAHDPAREDYLMVTLLDDGPVFDAMGKLRQVYPNVLHIDRPALRLGADGEGPRLDHRRTGDLELFSAFYEQVTGEAPDAARQAVFAGIAEQVRRQEREAEA
ncbi:MAG: exonuclease SbcCD subunit D [Candidatus Latescibacterota bacterium]